MAMKKTFPLIITLLPILLLSGCIDLYLTESNGYEEWVMEDLSVFVQCQDALGSVFEGGVLRSLKSGHFPMIPLLFGADPQTIGMGYDIIVMPIGSYEFCAHVLIPPGATKASGIAYLSPNNQCLDWPPI
jgi:hypothetical protein